MRRERLGATAAGAVAVLIALTTLTPGAGAVASVVGLDKAAHALAFAALTLPLAATGARPWPWVLLGSALYGGAIEIIQPHVGRSAEALDLVADVLGAAAGLALGAWIRRRGT